MEGMIIRRNPRRHINFRMDARGVWGLIWEKASVTVSIMCVGRVRICLDMYIAHPRIIFLVEHGVSPWRIFFRDMGSFQCLSSGVLCNKTWAMVVKRWKRIWVCSWSTPWSTEIKSSR